MHERRKKLLDMNVQPELLDHIEYVADLKANAMGEKIGAQCKASVDGVMFAINSWTTDHENTMREIGANAKAAAEGSHANGIAIQALTESLSATIAVEHVGRSSVSVIGSAGNMLYGFGRWLKDSLLGIAAILFIVGLITGKVTVADIIALFK